MVTSNHVDGSFKTLRPRQDGPRFADIFKWIFFNEIMWISIKILLKFVPSGPVNNIPALVQIMAWRRPSDKPLSEAMKVSLLTHICVNQWVNLFMATTPGCLNIPSFRIWGYVLHVKHITCVITNCGQHYRAIPLLFSKDVKVLLEENITGKLLYLSLDLFLKILLFQVTFLIFFSSAIFSPYYLPVGLLLQYVALFQSGN